MSRSAPRAHVQGGQVPDQAAGGGAEPELVERHVLEQHHGDGGDQRQAGREEERHSGRGEREHGGARGAGGDGGAGGHAQVAGEGRGEAGGAGGGCELVE